MGHPNLDSNLQAIIDAVDSPESTLHLCKNVEEGDIIYITWGKPDHENRMIIKILQPAGHGLGSDAAIAEVLFDEFQPDKIESFQKAGLPESLRGLKVAFGGANTRNPGTPMGMTMLAFHRITKGRHLLFYVSPSNEEIDEIGFNFPEPVRTWKHKRPAE